MKTKIYSLITGEVVQEFEFCPEIFGLDPRPDLMKLVIDWQLAKRMSGNHSTKTVSDVSGTTRKPFKQKGTGNARQGSSRSVHMRGGGVSHGPVIRSHSFKLLKKIRKLALRHALSSKLAEGKLLVTENFVLPTTKTAELNNLLRRHEGNSFFCIDDKIVDRNFLLASTNLHNVVVVPQIGANVYDIIKHDRILLTLDAVKSLEMRLK